jgi:hypothetical protein
MDLRTSSGKWIVERKNEFEGIGKHASCECFEAVNLGENTKLFKDIFGH